MGQGRGLDSPRSCCSRSCTLAFLIISSACCARREPCAPGAEIGALRWCCSFSRGAGRRSRRHAGPPAGVRLGARGRRVTTGQSGSPSASARGRTEDLALATARAALSARGSRRARRRVATMQERLEARDQDARSSRKAMNSRRTPPRAPRRRASRDRAAVAAEVPSPRTASRCRAALPPRRPAALARSRRRRGRARAPWRRRCFPRAGTPSRAPVQAPRRRRAAGGGSLDPRDRPAASA